MSESYIIQLSKAINTYASVPDDELIKFITVAHPVEVKKGEYFIKAGDLQPWLGFIISGVFRGFHVDDTGAEFTKHFFKENDFMTANSRSLVDKEFVKKESDYYFQALEDSTVLKIDRVEHRECLSHPCWQEIFAKEIERVHTIEERRIKQLLLADAETRYFNFLQDFPGLEHRIKQSHIASYVGVSPVSLSRIRTHIKSH